MKRTFIVTIHDTKGGGSRTEGIYARDRDEALRLAFRRYPKAYSVAFANYSMTDRTSAQDATGKGA